MSLKEALETDGLLPANDNEVAPSALCQGERDGDILVRAHVEFRKMINGKKKMVPGTVQWPSPLGEQYKTRNCGESDRSQK